MTGKDEEFQRKLKDALNERRIIEAIRRKRTLTIKELIQEANVKPFIDPQVIRNWVLTNPNIVVVKQEEKEEKTTSEEWWDDIQKDQEQE